MVWDKNEWKNQIVHMFISFWSGFILYQLISIVFSFKHWGFFLVGILVGFIIEFVQYLEYKKADTWNTEHFYDGIRDFCFYIVGTGLLFINTL